MNATYSIYRRVAGNSFAWVEKFDDLEEATKHVVALQATTPGKYIIYNVRLRTMVREWTT
jgi:hypothetical protein